MATINTAALVYPFDPTGIQASNKIINEQHIITSVNWRDYHFIVPKCAPFFEDSVKLKYFSPDNTSRYLVKGVDWYPTHKFMDASLACAKPISGSISFLNTSLEGIILLEQYQTVGGNWVLDSNKIALILADRLHNPRVTSWEQVVERPFDFPVIDHEWNLIDMVGMKDVVSSLLGIEEQLRMAGQGGLNAHIIDYSNPHKVDKTHVGLSAVANYPIATDVEAVAATATNRYLTPAGARKLTDALIGVDYNEHKVNVLNPHNTTAAQVGAHTKAEVLSLLNNKVDKTGVAYDTARVAGMTPDQYKSYVLDGVAADSLLFNGMTFYDLRQAIQGGASANAERFDNKTFSEATAIILSGTAAAATRFGGKTATEFANYITTLDMENAVRLNGRTDAQLKTWILSSPASSADLFGGYDANSFKAWVLTGTAANATSFDGRTFAQATSEIRNGLVNEARYFGGKDAADYRTYVLSGTANDSMRFGGYTFAEFLAQLELMSGGSANMVGTMPAQTVVDSVLAWSMYGLPGNNLDDNTIKSGVYGVNATGLLGTKPSGEDGNGSVLIMREDGPGSNDAGGNYVPGTPGVKVVQQYFNNSKTSPIVWVRAYETGSWGGWSHLVDEVYTTNYVNGRLVTPLARITELENNLSSGNVPGGNIDLVTIPTGIYYIKSVDAGTKPAGDDGFGHLFVSQEGSGTTVAQIYFDNISNTQWVRNYNNVSWSSWDRVLTSSYTATNYATRTEVETALQALTDAFTALSTTLNT